MTPHDLLAAFETLAEAPDGITRLRELVLQLAVRGKLVPQDQGDEPACLLLECIAAEKARLVKEGKMPKAKPLPLVSADEVPFAVPEGWVWCLFCNIAHIASNLVDPSGFLDAPHIAPDSIEKATGRLLGYRTIAEDGVKSGKHRFFPGQILYSKIRPNLSKVLKIDFSGLCSADMYPIDVWIDRSYLHLYMLSPSFITAVTTDDNRVAMPKVNQEQLAAVPIPVPPLPEQYRIVAKVDALMALLDRLEAARSERETTRAALRNAALAALRDAPDAEAVEAAWTRIAERMDDLFTDPADVAPLRQTILQLAVRGQLVPQDSNDEPACLLLERIAVEKARLVKEGRLPKPKSVAPVAEDDMPFEVPSRWEYVRLNDLLIEDSRNGLSAQPNQGPPGIEILRISAGTARNDAIVMEEDHRFLELEEEAILTYELQRGDLLACRFNGNLHYVGRVAVYEKYSGHRQVYPDKLIRFRVHQSLINPWYIRLAMNCQGIRSVVERMCATTAGNIGISATNLKTVAIPIPPFEEQHRIVAKVNALMALCAALEANLAATREAQAAFAAAAVHYLDV